MFGIGPASPLCCLPSSALSAVAALFASAAAVAVLSSAPSLSRFVLAAVSDHDAFFAPLVISLFGDDGAVFSSSSLSLLLSSSPSSNLPLVYTLPTHI